jgi:transposase
MAGLSNKKKQELAERMFIEEGMSGKAIASELEVSEVTISAWRKKGNWDDRRSQVLSAPHKIKEILLRELNNVASGLKPSIDADALAKISRVVEAVSSKTSTQIVITVFKEFDNWMAEQDPEMAVKFTEFHKSFILYKAQLES